MKFNIVFVSFNILLFINYSLCQDCISYGKRVRKFIFFPYKCIIIMKYYITYLLFCSVVIMVSVVEGVVLKESVLTVSIIIS